MATTGVASRLNALLEKAGLQPLDAGTAAKFEIYISLFVRWNARLNLSAIRDEGQILSRHIVESIVVASALPAEITSLLDFGSGAGLPGIPIALCRPEVDVTLAESQSKKAAFLREAVRVLAISAQVHADRAEALGSVFDCVVLRAVEKMPKAVAAAVKLVAQGGWLAVMTTEKGLAGLKTAAGAEFRWRETVPLPESHNRLLAIGQRVNLKV